MDAVALQILAVVLSAIFAAAGAAIAAWGAIRYTLGRLERDVHHAQRTADKAHERLDRMTIGRMR